MLIDTHVLLWLAAGDMRRISKKARDTLLAETEVVVSAASIWEISIKRKLGKLESPDNLLPIIEQAGLTRLPITLEHADLAGRLDDHHSDPFDRMLVAQSRIEQLPIVTRDKSFKRYDAEVIW